MLKSPAVTLSAYGNILLCSAAYHSPIITPSVQNQSLNSPFRSSGQCKARKHGFAAYSSRKFQSDQSGNLRWPELSSSTAVPTPYQIFQLNKDEPYSKRRFYELVKLYHPDRHSREQCSSDLHSILFSVRVERYRLVVAANDILSDPTKRRAYDKYGAGWNGCADAEVSKYDWGPRNDTKWSGFDTNTSPARNATWEDWEKWYNRNSNQKQEPAFYSNRDFLYLVFICMAIGGIGQATRLGDQSRTISERVEAVYDSCSKNIRTRRKTSHESENRHERVQDFLQTRDSYGYRDTQMRKGKSRNSSPPSEA